MKKQKNTNKTVFFKKIFIKICRLIGYEIIDQSRYEVPTLEKNLNNSLSIPGKKSITVPLGEFKITRKIKSLNVIFRSSTAELIMDQGKKRLFEKQKNEYTFRSLNSLLKSVEKAQNIYKKINYEITIFDTRSSKNDIETMKKILSNFNISNKIIEINLNDFKNKIAGGYSDGKFANLASLYSSLISARDNSDDLIYFVEDDYIHTKECITEMLFSYEKFSSLFNKEIFLLPADYPYLYTNNNSTKIFLGNEKHWQLVEESLLTFMTSRTIILDNFDKLLEMVTNWNEPFEKPLHIIYKKTPCFSPIPSLSIHCSNINSVYGLPPHLDWKMIWDENEDY